MGGPPRPPLPPLVRPRSAAAAPLTWRSEVWVRSGRGSVNAGPNKIQTTSIRHLNKPAETAGLFLCGILTSFSYLAWMSHRPLRDTVARCSMRLLVQSPQGSPASSPPRAPPYLWHSKIRRRDIEFERGKRLLITLLKFNSPPKPVVNRLRSPS